MGCLQGKHVVLSGRAVEPWVVGRMARSNQFLSVYRGRFFMRLLMFPCCFERTYSEKGIIEECL